MNIIMHVDYSCNTQPVSMVLPDCLGDCTKKQKENRMNKKEHFVLTCIEENGHYLTILDLSE